MQVDDEPHFTLFLIAGLNQQHTNQVHLSWHHTLVAAAGVAPLSVAHVRGCSPSAWLRIDRATAVQLTERPFPVVCRSLRGMYPYYTSRGEHSDSVLFKCTLMLLL